MSAPPPPPPPPGNGRRGLGTLLPPAVPPSPLIRPPPPILSTKNNVPPPPPPPASGFSSAAPPPPPPIVGSLSVPPPPPQLNTKPPAPPGPPLPPAQTKQAVPAPPPPLATTTKTSAPPPPPPPPATISTTTATPPPGMGGMIAAPPPSPPPKTIASSLAAPPPPSPPPKMSASSTLVAPPPTTLVAPPPTTLVASPPTLPTKMPDPRRSTLKPQLPSPSQNMQKKKELMSSQIKSPTITKKKETPTTGSSKTTLATPRSIINQNKPKSLKEILEQKAEEKDQEEKEALPEMTEEAKREEEEFQKFEAKEMETFKAPPVLERARCQGYLSKQGHHWNSWKRRWFVMRLTSLDFYKRRIKVNVEELDVGDNVELAEARARQYIKPQGSVKLGSIIRIQRDLVKYPQPFCFQLVCPDRIFAVQADTKSDMDLWIDEINDAVRAMKLGIGSETISGKTASSKFNRRTTVAGNLGSGPPSFSNTLLISKSFEEVRKLSPLVKSKSGSMAAAAAAKEQGKNDKGKNIYGLEEAKTNLRGKFTGKIEKTSPSSRRMTAPSGMHNPFAAGLLPRAKTTDDVDTNNDNNDKDATNNNSAAAKAMEKVMANENRRKSQIEEDNNNIQGKVMEVIDEDSAPLFLHKDVPDIKINLDQDVGKTILQKMQDGNVEMCYTSDTLARSTRVGLYFGAKWCEPCRAFLPRLVDFYSRLRLDGRDVEILFVSNDSHNNDFKDYYVYNMPWLAIPFDEDVRRFKLAEKLGVAKVPSLVFLDGNGHVLTTEGLDLVFNDPDGGHLFRMRSKAQQVVYDMENNNNTSGHTAYGSPSALTLHQEHSTPSYTSDIHDWRESDITGQRSPTYNPGHASSTRPGEISLPTLPMVPQDGALSPHERMIMINSPRTTANAGETTNNGRRRRQRVKRSPAYRRKLMREKQRRYKMTPRVLAQYIRWLDTLQVWPAPITDLYRELRSGVMLCGIVKVLVPDANFKGMNRKPRTMRPAVNNIEMALSVIWQRGRPNARRMPTAEEIFEGRSERIGWLVRELFQCFVMRPMRNKLRCSNMLRWYQEVLSAYGKQLSDRTAEPPYNGDNFSKSLWEDFHDGVNLACIMHYFCGNKEVPGFSGVDLSLMYLKPEKTEQFESNVTYIFELLSQLGIPLVWTVADFIAFPDESFLLWQIHALYLALSGMKCALPEVPYGKKAKMEAVTVTDVGAPIVINVKFRPQDQDASFASLSSGQDNNEGLHDSFEKVKNEGTGGGGWNSSTLSPDLTRKEKGANVVWTHPEESGHGNFPDSNESNASVLQQQSLQEQYGRQNSQGLQQYYNTASGQRTLLTSYEEGQNAEREMDDTALSFLNGEIAKLEDEKQSLLEAEKFASENPPTSIAEIQRAIQLKERRFMVHEEQRRLLYLLQSSRSEAMPTNDTISDKYSAQQQQQHEQMPSPYEENTDDNDDAIEDQHQVEAQIQTTATIMPAEKDTDLIIDVNNANNQQERQQEEGKEQGEIIDRNMLSPNSKYDYDLRRRSALKWLQNGHVVNIEYSNGSSQKKQIFKATEDKSGSTVFVWEGPPDDGRLGYLPANSIANVDTSESGAIVLNVYDEGQNLHTLSLSSPDAPADQLKLLANLSTIISS